MSCRPVLADGDDGLTADKWAAAATVEVGYDFRDDPGNPKWVLRAAVSLLLPT